MPGISHFFSSSSSRTKQFSRSNTSARPAWSSNVPPTFSNSSRFVESSRKPSRRISPPQHNTIASNDSFAISSRLSTRRFLNANETFACAFFAASNSIKTFKASKYLCASTTMPFSTKNPHALLMLFSLFASSSSSPSSSPLFRNRSKSTSISSLSTKRIASSSSSFSSSPLLVFKTFFLMPIASFSVLAGFKHPTFLNIFPLFTSLNSPLNRKSIPLTFKSGSTIMSSIF